MEWLKRLGAAIDYIEENLDKEISYDEAAHIACCSTYYFQRIFSYVSGVSLSEYIRRRKMTQAAFELQRTDNNVRVEKVYQQYTKADLCYFDDDGRKIMNTVWLDVPGIRDGDYIQCYTGNDNSGLFLNYSLSTLIFVAVFVIVMIILLILTGSEMQRIKKEEILQIILEDEKADEEI